MQYKVLSLLQPWASLVVMGHKTIETRSFNTKHRGQLLIHASLGKNRTAIESYNNFRFNGPLFRVKDFVGVAFNDLPFGAIIGNVNVEDVITSEAFMSMHGDNPKWGLATRCTNQEKAFGDYSPGRYGWLLSDPVMFAEPIPARGMLGLWTPDEATTLMIDQAFAAIQ